MYGGDYNQNTSGLCDRQYVWKGGDGSLDVRLRFLTHSWNQNLSTSSKLHQNKAVWPISILQPPHMGSWNLENIYEEIIRRKKCGSISP